MSQTEIVKKPFTCPHCQGKAEIEIEKQVPKVIISEKETVKEEHIHERPQTEQPKPNPHQEIANMLPKGVNFTKCTGEDCGKKIKNAKGLTTKFKTCTNCGANTVPKGKKYCPTCGKDEDSEEPFDESDVKLEEMDEDEE